MAMSKKDYVGIANILRAHDAAQAMGAGFIVADLTQALAVYFERDNPEFNAERFLEASTSKMGQQVIKHG